VFQLLQVVDNTPGILGKRFSLNLATNKNIYYLAFFLEKLNMDYKEFFCLILLVMLRKKDFSHFLVCKKKSQKYPESYDFSL